MFIRWVGGGHWDLLMAAYNDFTAYIANGERGGGHRDLPKFISQKEVLHSGCCIRSVL